MTLEELKTGAEQAANNGLLFEMNADEALDLLEVVEAQDAQIDDAWLAIGVEPLDAPSAMDLAAEIRSALEMERKRGRDELLLAVLAEVQGSDLTEDQKSLVSVLFKNVTRSFSGAK